MIIDTSRGSSLAAGDYGSAHVTPRAAGAPPRRERIAGRAVNAGLAVNVVLAVLKVAVGVIGHSRALLADGINSTSDVAYYIAVKIFTRLAAQPADREHPYGHHQMESIAAVVIGAFVITTAIAIFWDSINAAYDICTGRGGDPGTLRLFSLLTACGTIAVKIILFITTRSAATTTKNAALLALAYDHRNDIFSSAGAAVGISLGWGGMPWGDPLAGACVALIVLRTGMHILQESAAELMDTVPGDELERQVTTLAAGVAGVKSIEHLRAHRFGPYFVVNITIGVDGALTVAEGDRIATEVERRLDDGIELLKNIYVHFHPAS
ncbi:MAG: cation transporter [Chitinispirillaceae bacterium]|nr:cation transporter [Chitinispirillaceae bacterium]